MGVVLFVMNFREEVFKSIQTMVDRAIANCKVDRFNSTVFPIMNHTPIHKKFISKRYCYDQTSTTAP